MPTNAIIFIPAAGHAVQFASMCLDYCARHGYGVVGVITGNWPAVAQVLLTCQATVLVVARPDHLPEDRARIEVVVPDDAENTAPMPGSGRRRPRMV